MNKFSASLGPVTAPDTTPPGSQTVLPPAQLQSTVFGEQPYLLGLSPQHYQTWYRGVVSSTHNFVFNFYIPEYWIRIVKAVAHVQPLHATVPEITLTGTSSNTGGPEHPTGTPNIQTALDGGHRHLYFIYLADAAAFTNRNGTGYTSGGTTGVSIPESSAASLWTAPPSVGMTEAGDHLHTFDHTHVIDLTGATADVGDIVESADPATDVEIYIDGNLIESGINSNTEVDIRDALINTAASPAPPLVGTHTILLNSTKLGEVEVVIELYVVTRPPAGAF